MKGFSLVELMITVAIIGILSAVAIPAYQDYVTRSQVSEAITLGMGMKSIIGEYGWNNSQWPTAIIGPTNTPNSHEVVANLQGKYSKMDSIVSGIYPSATIVMIMISGKASGQTILFQTNDGAASWTCNSGTLNRKYRPNACKNE